MTRMVVGLVLALSTAACAARGATPSVAGPQGAAWGEAERVAVLRQYVGHLPIGGRVRVQTVDGHAGRRRCCRPTTSAWSCSPGAA